MKELKYFSRGYLFYALLTGISLCFSSCNSEVSSINEEIQQSLIASILNNSKPDNFNADQVIRSFEQLELTDSVCVQLQSSYLQAIKYKYGLEKGFARMDSVLMKADCPECKLNAYTSMGENYYARGIKDHGLAFFKNAVQQNKANRFSDSRYLAAAEAFINGLEKLQLGMKTEGFQSIDINGLGVNLENTEGKVVLLDFWATWCKPCKEDLPMLQSIYNKYGERDDFEMISISSDKDLDILKTYLAKTSMPWTHVYEGGGINNPLAKQYNGYILPTYYVIDKDGTITYNFSSYQDGEDLEEAIDKLFKIKP